jgi:hypothetical protein
MVLDIQHNLKTLQASCEEGWLLMSLLCSHTIRAFEAYGDSNYYAFWQCER